MICHEVGEVELGHPVHVAAHEKCIAKEGDEAGDVGGWKRGENLVLRRLAARLERLKILATSFPVEDSLGYQIAVRGKDSCECLSAGESSNLDINYPWEDRLCRTSTEDTLRCFRAVLGL
jgi:hypothetical protein